MRDIHILIISVSFIVIFGAFIITGFETPKADSSLFSNYTVTKAQMESPSLIIQVDSPTQLVQKAYELKATIIYDTNKGYAVLDPVNSIAYVLSYDVQWFGLNPLSGIGIMFTALIIDMVGLMVALNRNNKDE